MNMKEQRIRLVVPTGRQEKLVVKLLADAGVVIQANEFLLSSGELQLEID